MAWSASWRTAVLYKMSLSDAACWQCVRASTTTSNASCATPSPSMTLRSWLFVIRRRYLQRDAPSSQRCVIVTPGLAHEHLDAPVAWFYLLVWRGYQRLPFPAPNGTNKARA